LAYDGGAFRGWQRQPGLPTVQQAVEDALAAVLDQRVQVHGAARTDAGVHAEGQVASFGLRRAFSAGDALATRLPEGVRIEAVAPARPSFHARASAAGKRYRYRFAAGTRLAWDLGPGRPDWDRARAALEGLRGLPHLPGLASPARGSRPAPPLDEWTLEAGPESAALTVQAPAFRKHEVRNLAGHLAAVALGLAAPESLARLARGLRPWHGATAPPHGLTLLEVLYPPELDPFLSAALPAPGAAPARRPR
jgi:tRNA pseudouridine38-40 synthase